MKIVHKQVVVLILLVTLCTACQSRLDTVENKSVTSEANQQKTQIKSDLESTTVSTQPLTSSSRQAVNRVSLDSRIRGNDYINMLHGGYFVTYLGWYYISSDEDQALFKMRPDGSERTKVTDGYIGDFNIVRDWFYYTNSAGHLWKMRLDGTEKSLVYDGRIDNYIIIDDYLFYIVYENFAYNTYRMKLDGSDKQLLVQEGASFSYFDGDYYYFLDMDDWSALYRIHIAGDGSDKTMVYQHTTIFERKIIVQGNQLYAIASDGIWHIDLETKERKQLTTSEGHDMNLDEEWLYYEDKEAAKDASGNSMDFSASFYKVRLDGTDKQMISYLWPKWMYIPPGEWIYFLNVDKEDANPHTSVTYLAKIKKDGTGFTRLFEYKE